MRKWLIALFLAFALVLTGCAGVRENIIDLSESDVKNVEALKEASANLLETWPFYSGLIRGAAGPSLSEFPMDAINAMNALDKIAQEADHTDFTLGYALGLRIQMLSEVVKKAVEMYLPDVIDLVPLLL